MSHEYLFIDGGCLRATVDAIAEDIGEERGALVPIFMSLPQGADKIFYYDAIPAQEHREPVTDYEKRINHEHTKFDAIRALDRFHVSLGQLKGRSGKRRQKGVDVQLAVDMLMHAVRGNMTDATLLAGDDDFIPLIEALVREGVTVTIWHPKQASEQLLSAADVRRPFSLENSHSMLSRDGNFPAFAIENNTQTASGPKFSQPNSFDDGVHQYVFEWRDDLLKAMRKGSGSMWDLKTMRARGATFKTALLAFDAISRWPVAGFAVSL